MAEWRVSKEAARLHKDAHVWDMMLPWGYQNDIENKHATVERAVAHGYTLASLTVSVDWQGLAGAIKAIAGERAYFLANSDKFVLVDTFADVERAKRDGKLAIVFHFQGTNPIEGDLDMVETYYKLGVRHMLMAYNIKNVVGDGCMERTDGGLTRFGVALIEEMNRVGMIVDATHTGYRTTMDMFEVSKDPVIFSHSNPAALWNHPRNIKDDQIKACAKSGGVICINGVGVFLGDNEASPETVLRHIVYVAELVGPEYMGIGTDCEAHAPERGDFEAPPGTPIDPAEAAKSTLFGGMFNRQDLHQAAYLHASGGKSIGPDWQWVRHFEPLDMPYLTEAMLMHGFSKTEVPAFLARTSCGSPSRFGNSSAKGCPLRRAEAEPAHVRFRSIADKSSDH